MSFFLINEITASDAGPDIIRSHLFLLGDEQLRGEGWHFLKVNILAVKHLKINFLAWVPRKINNPASIRFKKVIS